MKHGWLRQLLQVFTGTSHRDGPTPAAAADAGLTQTVGPGPCGPVAVGCRGLIQLSRDAWLSDSDSPPKKPQDASRLILH